MAHSELRSVAHLQDVTTTTLLAYRRVDADRALSEQLALEAES